MATVEDVASLAISAVAADATAPLGIEQVGGWVAERYKELMSKFRSRQRRKLGSVTIPAAIEAGEVTCTLNSTSIVCDADAAAAIIAAGSSGAMGTKDWYIRIAQVWYPVTAFDGVDTLTIGNVFTDPDVTVIGYLLLKRFHALDVSARWIGQFVYPKRHRPLQMRALVDIDRIAPDRILTTQGPWAVAEATNVPSDTTDLGTAGAKRVEMYPYCRTEETVYYTYWTLPILTTNPVELLTEQLPHEIDPYVLREGVLIDIYRYRMSQAIKSGSADMAGFWRNEMRAQMTSWQTQIADAARADLGYTDVGFIYHALGLSTGAWAWDNDIKTGYEEWLVYGGFPSR